MAAVIITGLTADRGALVVVFHHVLADGIGGLAVLKAGVPTRQVLTEAGYLPDLVEGWLEGSDRSSLDQRIAALGEIGHSCAVPRRSGGAGRRGPSTVQLIVGQVMGDLIREPDEAS